MRTIMAKGLFADTGEPSPHSIRSRKGLVEALESMINSFPPVGRDEEGAPILQDPVELGGHFRNLEAVQYEKGLTVVADIFLSHKGNNLVTSRCATVDGGVAPDAHVHLGYLLIREGKEGLNVSTFRRTEEDMELVYEFQVKLSDLKTPSAVWKLVRDKMFPQGLLPYLGWEVASTGFEEFLGDGIRLSSLGYPLRFVSGISVGSFTAYQLYQVFIEGHVNVDGDLALYSLGLPVALILFNYVIPSLLIRFDRWREVLGLKEEPSFKGEGWWLFMLPMLLLAPWLLISLMFLGR
jgi:hypothetical protein